MSLRRFAQENSMASPRKSAAGSSGPSTPRTPDRPRPGYVQVNRSPLLLPSQSASNPFDWEAARGHKAPPYPSPISKKARRSEVGVGAGGMPETPRKKRVVRQKSFMEKIRDIPSRIAFEWSLFPHNFPVPSSRTSALLLGGLAHFLHFCVRVAQLRDVPDERTGWEDMYREESDSTWFDWTVVATILLVGASVGAMVLLFTHTRIYHLHSRPDPVASPNARFVREPENPPTLARRVLTHSKDAFFAFWRFLFNWGTSGAAPSGDSTRHVQALEVWDPSALELLLVCVYSPVHALLWMVWNAGNWIVVSAIMLGVSVQMRTLVLTYEAKLKDRLIIAAETMHEYDMKFVNPRINPVRKDACVMTHESEMVNHR
ncbi:hypothetical protein K488DRAFT_86018 [Vararia minispora EC-137]|uniref:Uncharacterized protein n=1 Tax=Vararia minispora EC-137 TaxID=1314806 RepID=A0ACB8QLN3_9AGAM|nr:hypothetical protein K488DRAFT_86018 [Vararia minispora EC-137]